MGNYHRKDRSFPRWSTVMICIFLFATAGAMLAPTALVQSLSAAEFLNKVAAQSDLLEIQASEFIAPVVDADTKPFAEMNAGATKTFPRLKEHLAMAQDLGHEQPVGDIPARLSTGGP